MEERRGQGRGGEESREEDRGGEGRRAEESRGVQERGEERGVEERRGEKKEGEKIPLVCAHVLPLSPPLHALTTRGYTCVQPQLVVHALNGRFSSYLYTLKRKD